MVGLGQVRLGYFCLGYVSLGLRKGKDMLIGIPYFGVYYLVWG